MAQPYNLTGITGQTSLAGFMGAANDLSGGLFGNLILLVIFLIMVFAWRTESPKRSIAGASFITALMAVFLRLLGWIPDQTLFISIIIAGASFVMLRWS